MKIYNYNDKTYTDLDSLLADIKNVSFPENVTDEMLKSVGVKCFEKIETKKDRLEEEKKIKLEELSLKFNSKINEPSGIKLNGKAIKMDITEHDIMMVRSEIDLMEFANEESGFIVDTNDNVYKGITKDEVINVYIQMLDAYRAIYLKFKAFKATIVNSLDITSVRNVIIKF